MFLILGSDKKRCEGEGGGRGLRSPVSSFHHRGQSPRCSLQTLTFLFLRESFYFTVWTKTSGKSLNMIQVVSHPTGEDFRFKTSLRVCPFKPSSDSSDTTTTAYCWDESGNKHCAWISHKQKSLIFVGLLWRQNSFEANPDCSRIWSRESPLS